MAGEEWFPNDIPASKQGGYGMSVMIGLMLVALIFVVGTGVAAVGISTLGNSVYVIAGVLIVLAAMLVWAIRRPARTQTSGIPDRIRVFPDHVEGAFHQRRGAPAVVLRIDYKAVRSIWRGGHGGGKEHFWVPGGIEAQYHFADPETVTAMEMVHGPPVPAGYAKSFVLSEESFDRIYAAFQRAMPNGPAPD